MAKTPPPIQLLNSLAPQTPPKKKRPPWHAIPKESQEATDSVWMILCALAAKDWDVTQVREGKIQVASRIPKSNMESQFFAPLA